MAIWEDSAVGTKCPNCAGILLFDEHFQKMSCRTCGSFFDPNSLDFSFQLKVMDTEKASENDSRVEFVCDSCGATVITDETTVADICAFCGSPVIAKRRLINEFKPDYIIPFKIDKDEASDRFVKWAAQYKKAPKDFSSTGVISGMKGVYLPFWLVDAKCCFDYYVKYDLYTRDVNVKRVPFDGAERVPDSLMRAVEPFNYDEMVPYNDGYLHGFFANRYDLSLVDMTDIVYSRIHGYLKSMYSKATEGTDFKENVSSVYHISQSYAMLPVWFLNYEYEGQKYQYAINGQTGEVQGIDVPFDRFHSKMLGVKKVLSVVGASLFALITSVLFLLLAYKLFDYAFSSAFPDSRASVSLWLIFALPILGVYLFNFIKKIIIKKAKETVGKPVYHVIDEAPEIYEYIDPTSTKDVFYYVGKH